MSLRELTLANVRCLERVEIELHPGHNLVWGPNGSGKTSLLEAAFLLGRGRSFRTRHSERLIRHGCSSLTVFGRVGEQGDVALGVEFSRTGGARAHRQGVAVGMTELAHSLAVQAIDPSIHKLLEEGAHRRRRWLDWAVFHVEPGFVDTWSRYRRVLAQRNAALRRLPLQAEIWEPELVRLGEQIGDWRAEVMKQLAPFWSELISRMSALPVELSYRRGWPEDCTLAEAVTRSRDRDRIRGSTLSGPHRSDVILRLNGRPARDVLSRGQQKLVAIAMMLVPLHLVRKLGGATPLLLLDDPAAELDPSHLERFLREVQQLPCQLVSTSLGPTSALSLAPDRLFHVERGRLV